MIGDFFLTYEKKTILLIYKKKKKLYTYYFKGRREVAENFNLINWK